MASDWLNWHRSGWSGSPLTNWQSIGMIGTEFCLSGRELVRVTLQWQSGTEVDYGNRIKFISMVRSSVVSLYKGKRPRTGPQRWSSTIETGSHQMSLLLSGIWVTSVTSEWVRWNLIDILSQYWHDLNWILSQWQIIGFSDTRVEKSHLLGLLQLEWFHPKLTGFHQINFQRGYPYDLKSCHLMVFKPLQHNEEWLK